MTNDPHRSTALEKVTQYARSLTGANDSVALYGDELRELLALITHLSEGVQAYRSGSYTLAQVWENKHGVLVPGAPSGLHCE